MKMSRKSILLTVCLSALLICLPNVASAKTLKMYSPEPADSFKTKGMVDAANEIDKLTKGKIKIKVFPGGQLGGYEEAVDEVRQGTIDIAATWLTKRWDPQLDMLNLPCYATLGYKQLRKVCFSDASPFPQRIDTILAKLGIVGLGPWPECYGTLIFAKGKRPEKFTGYENKKRSVRVPGMPLYRDTYLAMGYQTVTMDVSELWSAMQTGQVDGASGQVLEGVWLLGKDIVKHVEINRTVCPPMWLLINEDLWRSFTPEQQKIVRSTFNKHSLKTLDLAEGVDKDSSEKLKKHGIEVVEYKDDYYREFGKHIRKAVWSQYYDLLGKEFLQNLDKFVVETESTL